MNEQIEKMMAAENDSKRQARIQGRDFPWKCPVFSLAFALGKLTRIIYWVEDEIRIAKIAKCDLVEELRESAHYLLRTAQLIEDENEEDKSCKN